MWKYKCKHFMYCCYTVTCVVSGSGGQVRCGGVSIRKDRGSITVTTWTYLQSTQHDSGTLYSVCSLFSVIGLQIDSHQCMVSMRMLLVTVGNNYICTYCVRT